MMRFLAGFYLLVFGFIWTWQLKAGSPGAELFPSLLMAQLFGYGSFFLGLFSISPKLWSWKQSKVSGDAVAIFNQLLRLKWYGVGAFMLMVGCGLFGLAILGLQKVGAPAAFLASMTGMAYAIGGVSLIRTPFMHQSRQEDEQKRSDPTNLVLRIARHHKGRVTPTEIATETNLTVHDARSILQSLAQDGFCEERISEGGASFYLFAEFANPNMKRDIMEPDLHFDHDVVFDHQSQSNKQTNQANHKHYKS